MNPLLRQPAEAKIFVNTVTPRRICELYPCSLKEPVTRAHQLENPTRDRTVPADFDLEKEQIGKVNSALGKILSRRPVKTENTHKVSQLKERGLSIHIKHLDDLPRYISNEGRAV